MGRALQTSFWPTAAERVALNHYTRSLPSGKSVYVEHGDAVVVWSLPANPYIGRFLTGRDDLAVWELSRLWAPDGHAPNLLTAAISAAVAELRHREPCDVVVAYADPNVGHHGGIYRAASWTFDGQSEPTRVYVRGSERVARRAFHSGGRAFTRAEIERRGWREVYEPGKLRYVRGLSRRGRRALRHRPAAP